MSYPVYLVSSRGAPRNHHSIFVQTHPNQSGHVFQVTSNIQIGMKFEFKASENPEASVEFIEKEYIGTVAEDDYARMKSIVEGIEPPGKQFDGAKRLDPGERLRRCQEWTAEVVRELRRKGVLES
jgi:hypothetical protein